MAIFQEGIRLMRSVLWIALAIVSFLFPARLWSNDCNPKSCISLAGTGCGERRKLFPRMPMTLM